MSPAFLTVRNAVVMHNDKSSANFSPLYIYTYIMAAQWADNEVHVPKNCLEFRQFGTSVKGRNAYFFRWWQSPFVVHISTSSYLKVFFKKLETWYYEKPYPIKMILNIHARLWNPQQNTIFKHNIQLIFTDEFFIIFNYFLHELKIEI